MDQATDTTRALGLLVGLALGDGWSGVTEIALCVADAAAPGLPLDDPRSVDLLQRNLRERRATASSSTIDVDADDAAFAAGAIVAMAHRHDAPARLSNALSAVLGALDAPVSSQPQVLAWATTLAETISTGRFVATSLGEQQRWSSPLQAITGAMHSSGGYSSADVRARVRSTLAPGALASSGLPAWTGALVGAIVGLHLLPAERIAALSGWPDADAEALLRVATDVAAPRERGAAGVPVGIGVRPATKTDESVESLSPPEATWRVSHVALASIESGVTR